MTMRYRLPITFIVCLVAMPAHAGIVQTLTGRFEGKVILHKDHLTVDAKKLVWDDVLYLLPDSDGKPLIRPQRVHLKNGESWAVELVGLADKKLDVRSDLFGQKQFDLRLVAALDFAASSGRTDARKLRVLYRAKGEPIPGKLLGLKQDKLTIDSAVGELDLPREGLVSYRFADATRAPSPGDDDVTLIDGSLFRGKLHPGETGYLFEHATLGKATIPAAIIRSVVRHPARMFDLTDAKPVVLKARPLLATKNAELAAPPMVEGSSFVKGLLFEPNLTAEYQIPGMAEKKGRLRAVLLPVGNSAGDVRLRIKIGDKVVVERELAPMSKAEAISLPVIGGDVLEISVDFGTSLRFPCGVVLGDPHVIWE